MNTLALYVLRFTFCALLLAIRVYPVDIIPADWRVDWMQPAIRYSGDRNTNAWTVYTNLPASTSVAGVNAAIVNCPAGQMIRLSNGTFTVSSRILVGRSNIRITGGGPTVTILQITGSSSSGLIEIGNGGSFPPTFVRNWTAGYSKDATTITLASVANIDVGDMLILTQTAPGTGLVNGAGDEGDCVDCSGAIQDVRKTLQHHCRVTSVSGTDVGITPALGITNWASGFSPQAYNYSTITTNVIIEDLQIDNSASAFGSYGIFYQNTVDTLVQRVYSKRAANRHITSLHCAQLEVIDSYFTDSKDRATHSYGFAPYNATGFWCVNNIFEGVTGIFKPTSASMGVFAYYYATNIPYTPDANWLQAPIGNHGSHSYGILIEGGIAPSIRMDNVHGSGSHNVIFRNRLIGHETNRTDNAIALALQATNRCHVIAGNVLGKTNFHTQWRMSYNSAGSSSTKAVEEYGYVDVDYRTTDGDSETFSSSIITHNQISQTLNGGTNGGVYWASGYSGSLQLESSYIFSSKPDWWGNREYPSIGPDALSTSTNDVTVFNPARGRFDAAMGAGNMALAFTPLVADRAIISAGPGRKTGRKLTIP